MEAPIYLKGRARPGPTFTELLLMHAVGRLLHPEVENVQVSVGERPARAGSSEALHAGVNDLGGTLMNESISRAAGARHGQRMGVEDLEAIVAPLGRPLVQRSTLYTLAGAPTGP